MLNAKLPELLTYLPKYKERSPESYIYLECKGSMSFTSNNRKTGVNVVALVNRF